MEAIKPIKPRPRRMLIGKTNKGQPFVVAVDHVASVTPNENAEHIAFIRMDDGSLIVAESERGVADVLAAMAN